MIIRPETGADHEAIRRLVTVTMRANEAELVELVRGSEHYLSDLALVAEDAGRVLGYAMFSNVGLEGMAGRPVLALAPLCVWPDRQRQGVGTALVRTGLDRADRRGAPLVTVLGDPAYYRRFGFEPSRRYGIEPPSRDIPEDAFMVKPLSGYDDELQGRVVYPRAFDGTWA